MLEPLRADSEIVIRVRLATDLVGAPGKEDRLETIGESVCIDVVKILATHLNVLEVLETDLEIITDLEAPS